MSAICGKCCHWRAWWPEIDGGETDESGVCHAIDPVTLPHAWRYAFREVVAVRRDEESLCPRYKES